jgi:hypothetical protein
MNGNKNHHNVAPRTTTKVDVVLSIKIKKATRFPKPAIEQSERKLEDIPKTFRNK